MTGRRTSVGALALVLIAGAGGLPSAPAVAAPPQVSVDAAAKSRLLGIRLKAEAGMVTVWAAKPSALSPGTPCIFAKSGLPESQCGKK